MRQLSRNHFIFVMDLTDVSARTPKFESAMQLCRPSGFLIVLFLSVIKMCVVENSQPSIVSLFMCLFLTLTVQVNICLIYPHFNYLQEMISVPVFILLLDKKNHVNLCLPASSAIPFELRPVCCLMKLSNGSISSVCLPLFLTKKSFGHNYWVACFTHFFLSYAFLPFKMILKPSSRKATSNFCISFLVLVWIVLLLAKSAVFSCKKFWQLSFKMCIIGCCCKSHISL